MCPADKRDYDTNNYRNKLNLESGKQTVLSILSSTFSRQYGGPLAEGPHFSTIAAQREWKEAKRHALSEEQWWKYHTGIGFLRARRQHKTAHIMWLHLAASPDRQHSPTETDKISGCLCRCADSKPTWEEASKQNKTKNNLPWVRLTVHVLAGCRLQMYTFVKNASTKICTLYFL